MGIVMWIVIGMVAASAATLLMPDTGPTRIGLMLSLGVVGALLGGFIGTAIGLGELTVFDVRSLMMALGGEIFLVFCSRTYTSRVAA